jgi:hypothetical protein
VMHFEEVKVMEMQRRGGEAGEEAKRKGRR